MVILTITEKLYKQEDYDYIIFIFKYLKHNINSIKFFILKLIIIKLKIYFNLYLI